MRWRFEIVAAVFLGILLPVLETIRRGWDHWSVSFTTMFEDYAAGAALLVAAGASLRRAAWATRWMIVSWSGITFMMLISTVSQIERHLGGDLEERAAVVLLVKVMLLAACVVALLKSIRAVGDVNAG
jgi:hypothetical protein